MNSSAGNAMVEYLLVTVVFVIVVIIGTETDAGIIDAYAGGFRKAYTRFTQMVATTDIAP